MGKGRVIGESVPSPSEYFGGYEVYDTPFQVFPFPLVLFVDSDRPILYELFQINLAVIKIKQKLYAVLAKAVVGSPDILPGTFRKSPLVIVETSPSDRQGDTYLGG